MSAWWIEALEQRRQKQRHHRRVALIGLVLFIVVCGIVAALLASHEAATITNFQLPTI